MTRAGPSSRPLRLLLRVPVPWVFVLTYLIGVALEAVRPTRFGPRLAGLSLAAGIVLFTIGAAVAGSALVIFHRARTTTTPGEASARLVTSGPYRLTRNPMYVGLTLAYLGEAGLLRQLWPIASLPLVLAYVNGTVIPLEESRLVEVFGADYETYRARVRRWI